MHIGPCLLLHPLVLMCVSLLVCGCKCINMCTSLSILCGVCFGTIVHVCMLVCLCMLLHAGWYFMLLSASLCVHV